MSAPSVMGCCRYGRGERVVDDDERAALVGDRGDGLDVDARQQRVRRRLQPHHRRVVGPVAGEGVDVGQVGGRPLHAERAPHLGDQAERAAVGVVAEDDTTARRDEAQHVVLGGEPAGERQPVARRLQRGDARLQCGTRRVARSRVLEALVPADAVLGERRRQRDRGDDGTGRRVGLLSGVHGAGVEAPPRLHVLLTHDQSAP